MVVFGIEKWLSVEPMENLNAVYRPCHNIGCFIYSDGIFSFYFGRNVFWHFSIPFHADDECTK